ncbi:MAG: hypothetical protein IMZ52_03575 [Actinobacteria bacterium]|nr:hypothetical protein [Actinomycetota bacterium]MBE3114604.1 hypothetical protein [Actinomycetota bacterium]
MRDKTYVSEYNKKYYVNHKEEKREYDRKYNLEHKQERSEYRKNYYRTHIQEEKDYSKNYKQSENGKKTVKKHLCKRNRRLKWIPLWDNPFPEEIKIDWHHINNLFVIPIPRTLHQKHITNNTNKHRILVNVEIERMYKINVEELLYNCDV